MRSSNWSRHRRGLASQAILGLACLLAAEARAADEFSADLHAGYIRSDNVEQDTRDLGSSIYEIGSSFAVAKRTSSLDLAADADVIYRHFTAGEFRSNFLPKLRAAAIWAASENQLYFTAQEDLGQVSGGSKLSLQPQDRENINVLTLGPDYFLSFSDDTRLRVGARYSNVNYSQSDLDSQRLRGELRLERSLSSSSVASLGGFATRTTFKGDDISQNSSQGVTVGFSNTGLRTQLSFAIGAETLHLQGGSFTGIYGKFEVERRVSERSRLSAHASRQFGDSTDAFLFGQSLMPALGEVVTVQVHAVPERQTGLGVRYDLDGRKVLAAAAADFYREDVLRQQDGGNFKSQNYLVSLGYRFTPAISVSAFEELQHTDLPGNSVNGGRYLSSALELEWNVQKRFILKARAERFKRSDSPQDFTENRYSLMFVWHAYGTKTSFARQPIRVTPRSNSQFR